MIGWNGWNDKKLLVNILWYIEKPFKNSGLELKDPDSLYCA